MFYKKSFNVCFYVFLALWMTSYQAHAADCISNHCRPYKNIVGTVQKIRLDISRIFILDEDTKRVWDFFVHSNLLRNFKEGDRVRIYYESIRLPAVSIKKMTPVEYDEKTQNEGILYQRNP